MSTILANWGVLQFVGIDRIVELSDNWEVSVFNGSTKVFSILIISHTSSVTNAVDMCEIEVFIGGTTLT